VNSREKGCRGERKAAAVLNAVLGTAFRRGVQHAGGPDSPDITGALPGVHFAVKRAERHRVPASAWIGKRLSRLAKTYPERFSKSRQRDSDIWVIYPQNEQAEQETEETWK